MSSLNARAPDAVVSIHDVAGTNLHRIEGVLDRLASLGVAPVTLLVIPDSGWDGPGLERLERWRMEGIDLAAHGWRHRCGPVIGTFHRFHGRFLSRNVAEHLSVGPDRIADIIRSSHGWFRERGLGPFPLYVPPAWALGPVSERMLRGLPFRWYETATGIRDARTGRRRVLPLVGFEADTRARALILSVFNRINVAAAAASGRPIRIAIHPHDFSLGLSRSLSACLARRRRFLRYSEAAAGVAP